MALWEATFSSHLHLKTMFFKRLQKHDDSALNLRRLSILGPPPTVPKVDAEER